MSFFDFSKNTPATIKMQKIPTYNITPTMILENLNARILLESAYQETGRGRYSLMLLALGFMVVKENQSYKIITPDSTMPLIHDQRDFLDWIQFFQDLAPKTNFDFPIPLGGIGYLGFEFFEEIEAIAFKKPKEIATYDCAFMFGKAFLVFDHLYECAYLVAVNYANESSPSCLENQLSYFARKIEEIVPKKPSKIQYTSKIISDADQDGFSFIVKRIKEEIYKGNLLQCVPSRRIKLQSDMPPIEAYKNLKQNNPSPYMFFLDFDSFKILGASPEVMTKIKDNKIYLKPIAGTRKRGADIAEDLLLEKDLQEDIKENAEHLMLVDLARNDLGKISKIGSVYIKKFKQIERYSKVMHIVSEVCGDFDDKNFTLKDAIFATFPAGTVSGAPKIQAIKTISNLETYQRGVYAGLIGYFDNQNNFDSAIIIRTAVYQNGVYYLQAGAGVVQDSDPYLEYKETQNKMLALLNTIMGKNS